MNAPLATDCIRLLPPLVTHRPSPYAAQKNHNALLATIATTEAMRAVIDTLPRVRTHDTRIVDADDVVARLDEVLADLRASVALLGEVA